MQPAITGAGPDALIFATSYLLLAVTPGPNFAVVSDAGLSAHGRQVAAAVLGVAMGASTLSLLMAGSVSAWLADEGVRRMVESGFVLYLLYLAGRSWMKARAVRRLLHLEAQTAGGSQFRIGFLTAAANPATALFFAASPLHQAAAGSAYSTFFAAGVVFVTAFSWFGLVAWSMTRWRHVLKFSGSAQDIAIGFVFLGLAILTLVT